MPPRVLIRGDGVAACCCARLLGAGAFQVALVPPGRPKLPALLVSGRTQSLLADVFADRGLFRGLPKVRKRVVAWGPEAPPVVLPHSATVVAEQVLLDRLWASVSVPADRDTEAAAWTIFASPPLPPSGSEHRFGSRIATTTAVQIHSSADHDACWIESTAHGWLFLLPLGEEGGWLMSVGAPPESLLEQSRLVAPQLVGLAGPAGEFPAYPRILSPLGDVGWLACGSAAMAFDPLCGEGTGNAVREAILASAVVRAAGKDFNPHDLLAHYSARLMRGFLRHLLLCRDFYAQARGGPWWDSETRLLEQGIEWMKGQISRDNPFRYRLLGFELQPLSSPG